MINLKLLYITVNIAGKNANNSKQTLILTPIKSKGSNIVNKIGSAKIIPIITTKISFNE